MIGIAFPVLSKPIPMEFQSLSNDFSTLAFYFSNYSTHPIKGVELEREWNRKKREP